MGIAWLDREELPPMNARELRTGGLPLLETGQEWPECPRCDAPMLFRAQMPIAITSLAAASDDRLVLMFECHAETDFGICEAGAVIISRGKDPREAPTIRTFDVLVDDIGANQEHVKKLATELQSDLGAPRVLVLPGVVFRAQPASIAEQAVHALQAAGATAAMRPAPVVMLTHIAGGILVPFDDGLPGMSKTTLPPLQTIVQGEGRKKIRGLIGGATPGHRDVSLVCGCGKPTRTAVRLLASRSDEPGSLLLGAAVAQICLTCNVGTLHRTMAA